MRILIAAADPSAASEHAQALTREGHAAETVALGATALARAESGQHDLVLLDLRRGGARAHDLLRQLHQEHAELRVIAISADPAEGVRGLDEGADTYLPASFSYAELSARIRALLRRAEEQDPTLQVGDLVVDCFRRSARRTGGPPMKLAVELTTRELQLLVCFMSRPDQVQTRAQLAERVWGAQFSAGNNVVEVYVKNLREKLRRLELSPIATVRGVGYVLETPRCQGE
ncbi:MAG: response regulator transcription factor [Planctomycetota bacterium]